MLITADQIKPNSRRKIGKLNSSDVYMLESKGGLYIAARLKPSGNGVDVLGMGQHPALARHVASIKNPDLQFTELSKSEEYPVECFSHLIPEALALTEIYQAATESK